MFPVRIYLLKKVVSLKFNVLIAKVGQVVIYLDHKRKIGQ